MGLRAPRNGSRTLRRHGIRPPRIALAGAAALLLGGGLLAIAPSYADPSTTSATTDAAAARSSVIDARAATDPSISWDSCEDATQLDCGTIDVPLDYRDPDGEQITLGLERRPAADQEHKIGTLFFDSGGPGGTNREFARKAGTVVDEAVLQRFDFVGFDPRGVGSSTPLRCFGSDEEFEQATAGMIDVPVTDDEIDAAIDSSQQWSSSCAENAPDLLPHLSTLNVARDLDLLREAVGDEQLTYVGWSYGTYLGATYAAVFPEQVRALALDAAVDPNQRANERLDNKSVRSGGFETALDGFLTECDAAGETCAFNGDDGTPRERFDRLRDHLRSTPVEAEVDGRPQTVDLSMFTGAVYSAMYRTVKFAPLAEDLGVVYDAAFGAADERERASNTELRTFQTTTPPGPAPNDGPYDPNGEMSPVAEESGYSYNGSDTLQTINCVDGPQPRGPEQYREIAEEFEAEHPTFGRQEALSELPCASWPESVDDGERYAGPWDAETANPVLVVSGTHDPATPYDMGQAMTEQLGDARLLTVEGYGHISRLNYNTCALTATTDYLLEQNVPAAGTTCEATLHPFE